MEYLLPVSCSDTMNSINRLPEFTELKNSFSCLVISCEDEAQNHSPLHAGREV
jgi:hypothetical protein